MFLDKKASRAIGTSYSRCGCRLPPVRRCKAIVSKTHRLLKEIENIKQKQLTYISFSPSPLDGNKKAGTFQVPAFSVYSSAFSADFC